ncbi:metallophosphoesterase [Azospirillum argentinense]|uniref:Metallophosphoesterase n=1 Tax=Azospirillum argentinense TaxID=2970906 RepID=A0A060DND6_9PROT|nr:metallophosphoesterase family protein [Azospirillum argentinense]AIB12608.1 metallophosphoesterase [Azospirillum argentinense]EZQ09401.1 metallophosphoesterase [Azospirillum argentinense]
MATFFISDTHFGDHRVIWMYKRPFATVSEMDAAMIEKWNAVVGEYDEIWHLGDFAVRYSADRISALLRRLNGTKHLIVGNNDPAATIEAPEWESVQHYRELTVDSVSLVLCHYAFRSWNGMYRGRLNLHGHSHGRLASMKGQYDVGADVFGFAPVTVTQIVQSRQPRRSNKSRTNP